MKQRIALSPPLFARMRWYVLLILALSNPLTSSADTIERFIARDFNRLQSTKQLHLLFFSATWCPACHKERAALEKASLQLGPIAPLSIIEADFEREYWLAKRFAVKNPRTLLLFLGSQELARTTGALSADEIAHWIIQKKLPE